MACTKNKHSLHNKTLRTNVELPSWYSSDHTNLRSHIYCVLYLFIRIATLYVKYEVCWHVPMIHPRTSRFSLWLKTLPLFAKSNIIIINNYIDIELTCTVPCFTLIPTCWQYNWHCIFWLFDCILVFLPYIQTYLTYIRDLDN